MKHYISTIILILILMIPALSQESDNNFTKEDLEKNNVKVISLFREKKFEEALPVAQKSILMANQLFGKKHFETAKSMRNLGYIQFFKGDKKEAEETFEEAFDIYKDLPDLSKEAGSSVAEMLELLASIKYREQIQRGEKHYKLALEWREKYEGKDSPKTLNSLAALATIKYRFKDYKEAADLYQRILEVGKANESISKTDMETVYYRCKCAYRKMGKIDEFESIKNEFGPKPKRDVPVLTKGKTQSDQTEDRSPKIINGGVINGKAIRLPKPQYSAVARASNARGEVLVQVLIDEKGNVVSACTINKVHFALAEASENAAYGAKFQPTTLKGETVRVLGVITYVYN